MAFIPVNTANVQLSLQNDTQQLRTTIFWLRQRYQAYNLQLTPAVMTGLGISSVDQTAITAFINDLGRLVQFANGTLPATAVDLTVDIANVLGVL